MITGAQKRTLRNTDVAADDDALQVKQPAFLSEPDVIADLELPGKGDFDLWLNRNASTDFGPESAQHGSFEGRQTDRAQAEEEQTYEQPKAFAEPAGAAIEGSGGIG